MASLFSMLNIAYFKAGFKSPTHVYCSVIEKAVCLYQFIGAGPWNWAGNLPAALPFSFRRFPEYLLQKQGIAAIDRLKVRFEM